MTRMRHSTLAIRDQPKHVKLTEPYLRQNHPAPLHELREIKTIAGHKIIPMLRRLFGSWGQAQRQRHLNALHYSGNCIEAGDELSSDSPGSKAIPTSGSIRWKI